MATDDTLRPWHADVVLADGSLTAIRTATDADLPLLRKFFAALTPEALQSRYFHVRRPVSEEEIVTLVAGQSGDCVTLIAATAAEILGLATYHRGGLAAEAEVAFLVAESHQTRGIATLLLEHLAAIGRRAGIEEFVAEALPQNRRMLSVFSAAGYAATEHLADDVVHIRVDLTPSDEALDVIGRREQIADAMSLSALLRPRSIAVIGASRRPGSVGHEVLRSLLLGDFNGPVYPVNPAAEHVCGVAAYPSIENVPGTVDLAIITVPAKGVPSVVDAAGQAGVRAAVVISAGFAETGPEGAQLETTLRASARAHGMRIVGPNCMGVLTTASDVRMNATFAPDAPAPGRIGLLSQSGALGVAVLSRAARSGIGISSFVSVGNKVDVSGNDLLQYWESDPDTDIALLYLESFGNPRKFARIARRMGRSKPIVAIKSGRTTSGSAAAQSHTAAAANADVAVDALFRQCGVIRVDTLSQLFDVARLLSAQPLPAGRRLAIVTNSGGPGILASDAADAAGLVVAPLTAAAQSELRTFLPAGSSVSNPVDLAATATPRAYARALDALVADGAIDAVLVICTPTQVTDVDEVAAAVAQSAAKSRKTVLACFLGMDVTPPQLGKAVPSYAFPEPAVAALGRIAEYAAWRDKPTGAVPQLPELRRDDARAIVREFLAQQPDGGWLPPALAVELVRCYDIPADATVAATTADEAVAAAASLGFPVALKAAGASLLHKSDRGGVALRLAGPDAVRSAYEAMQSRLGDSMTGAAVQHQQPAGVETVAGVVHDATFGPLVMFGMGGVTMSLLGDQSYRLLPVTDLDAAELVRSLRASELLFGYRGSPTVDTAALERMLIRVGQLAGDLPQLAELDLNPVIATENGVHAVDVKVRLAPKDEIDPLLRRLR